MNTIDKKGYLFVFKIHASETICHIHHSRPCFRFQLFYILRISKILQDQRFANSWKEVVSKNTEEHIK